MKAVKVVKERDGEREYTDWQYGKHEHLVVQCSGEGAPWYLFHITKDSSATIEGDWFRDSLEELAELYLGAILK